MQNASDNTTAMSFGRRGLLVAGASALALGLGGLQASAAPGPMRVGAGKAAIAVPVPISGFATILDPLYVRIMAFDDGGTRGALVSIDLTSLDGTLVTEWATLVGGVIGADPARVVIYAAHNFSSPHAWNPDSAPTGTDLAQNALFLTAISNAMQQAASASVSVLASARVGAGYGTSKLAVSRNELSSLGWWIGFNDTEFSDPLFSVLRFDDQSGKPIAIIANVAVQPSVLDSVPDANGDPVVSADLAGSVATRLENYYGDGVIGFFVPGSGGDQSPIFKGVFNIFPPTGGYSTIVQTQDEASALLNQIGGRMTADVVRVSDAITTRHPRSVSLQTTQITVQSVTNGSRSDTAPVLTHTYDLGAATTIPVTVLAIDDIAFVGTTPELSAEIGVAIRELSPFHTTLVATMVGPAAKYLPTSKQFARFNYEAIESQYAPGAGEVFALGVGRYLASLGG